MWKLFSRGVRETFEKGFRVLRPEKTVKNDTNDHTTYCCKVTPSLLDTLTKCKCTGNENSKGAKGKTTTHNAENTILSAVSCSSALALGWVLSQPCHWRKWWCQRSKGDERKKCNLIRLLGKVANNQPLAIRTDISSTVNTSDKSDVVDGVTYGPKTAEEVLNEATEEFFQVHESAISFAENRRGVDFIVAKRHREAVSLFISASKRGSVSAAYNLAQCYENGLGVKQDFTQAAKWYRVAADRGHALAKYNLGVFYAHGWGGLQPCNKTARKLFEEAAEKGQPDAKAALGLDNSTKKSSIQNDLVSKDWGLTKETCDPGEQPLEDNNDPNKLYTMALSYESSACGNNDVTHLVMQLHKMASDMGHAEAKARYQLLETYEAIGLLSDYFCNRVGSKSKFFREISPAIVI